VEDAEETRPLSRVEHDLLDALLRHDFSGVEPLREQARAVSARRGCGCGCGTIELVVDPDAGAVPLSTASGPVPGGGEVLDAGTVVGGALLFVDAIQGMGVFPIDLHKLVIDFLAAGGKKWLPISRCLILIPFKP